MKEVQGWNIPDHLLNRQLRPRMRQQEIPVPAPDMHFDLLQYLWQDGVDGRGNLLREQRRLHGGVAGYNVFVRGMDGGFHGGEVEVGGYSS